MYTRLLDHVVKNIWTSPEQDFYTVIKPKKISRFNGDRLFTHIHWDRIKLPTPDQYHVYQIGSLPPSKIGLGQLPKNTWISVQDVINTNTNMTELYLKDGSTLPRFKSYLRLLNNGNFILIIPRFGHNANLNEEGVYLRFYKSSYLTSRLVNNELSIKVTGEVIKDIARINTLNHELESIKLETTQGYGFGYINGMFTTHINANLVKIGDWVELVEDKSIIRTGVIKLEEASQYLSTLDGVRKYLINYTGRDPFIHYKDDIDFFITQNKIGPQFTGSYYHQNNLSDVRMVTHKDFGLSVDKVNVLKEHDSFVPNLPFYVNFFIRDSGYRRKLPYEHNRIHELYKLPDALIDTAMNGTLSNLPEWRASHLEQSPYTTIMDYRDANMPLELIEDTLGYDAITKVVADNPIYPNLNQVKEFDLPQQSHKEAVILEYKDRLLTNIVSKSHSSSYHIPLDSDVDMIESYRGLVDQPIGELDLVDISYLKNNSRYFKRPLRLGLPDGDWVEVDKESDDIDFINYKWNLDLAQWGTYARSEEVMGYNKIQIPSDYHFTRLSLTGDVLTPEGLVNQTLPISYDKVFIFFNGYSLVEGIDYIIDWPIITIFNKVHFLKDSPYQEVIYLGMGIPEGGKHRVSKDSGFVFNGYLSNNNRFDLRDDKVVRVHVGGKLYDQNELSFYETGDLSLVDGLKNGMPYAVDYPSIVLKGLSDSKDLFAFREVSRELDGRVSALLDTYVNYPEVYPDNAIPTKYNIVSPFFNSLLVDLNNGSLILPEDNEDYTIDQIESLVEDYLPLLASDPCKLSLDLSHLAVHPHALDVAVKLHPKHHYFLHCVNEWFLNNLVEMHTTLILGVD